MTNNDYQSQQFRRAQQEKMPFAQFVLLLVSVMSGGMLFLAVPHLISGNEWDTTVKAALLALSGVTVSYAVSHLAVKRGAPLAAVGYGWASVVSVLSIGIVGAGLASATFAGLTFRDVEQLSIESHGEVLSTFVAERSAAASEAARIVPAINAISSDLEQKRDCEFQSSCISGYRGGGDGPVARLLGEKSGKAATLAQQVQNGDTMREQAVGRLNALFAEYQTVANNDKLSMPEKRRTLRGIDLKIRQTVSELDEAVPVALLTAYGDELKGGAELAGRPEVTRKVSDILRQHGRTIAELADRLPGRGDTAPAFPKATGVSDTFAYILHFMPIAAIVVVVELVLPISLWLYVLFALVWWLERNSPREPAPRNPEDAFHDDILPAVRMSRPVAIVPVIARDGPDDVDRPRRASGRRKPFHNDNPNSEQT